MGGSAEALSALCNLLLVEQSLMYLSVDSCHEGGPYAESGDMGDLVGQLVQQTFKYVKYE